MAPRAERPPSEQGVEYQTLDALEELTRKVQELMERPALVAAHPNWWDVLPMLETYDGHRSSFGELVGNHSGWTSYLQLPSARPSGGLVLRVVIYADRIELSLQINGGWIPWQRALFFERPLAVA
ncbi:MAG TPA: hypothetical protein VJX92_13905 [Methylomirabilota bacterium]|nr:hypothetical protein [Methylomirabilota bacterium]